MAKRQNYDLCDQPRWQHAGIGESCPATPPADLARQRVARAKRDQGEDVCGLCGEPRELHTGIGERCPV